MAVLHILGPNLSNTVITTKRPFSKRKRLRIECKPVLSSPNTVDDKNGQRDQINPKFVNYSHTGPPKIAPLEKMTADILVAISTWTLANLVSIWHGIMKMARRIAKLDERKMEYDRAPGWFILLAYFAYVVTAIMACWGGAMRIIGLFKVKHHQEHHKQKNFVKLYSDFESFYNRNLYGWVRDGWNRPICSHPGATFSIIDRMSSDFGWTFRYPGTSTDMINLASYNYLGFGENSGLCIETVARSIGKYGLAVCSCQCELGNQTIHRQLERVTAEFLGVEDAICFPTGFSTNAMNIPCFVSRGCLVLSDELNHASLILGCRLSGATVWKFKHNDMEDLERKLVDAVIRIKTGDQFRKILICVEGIYSMEGTIAKLPEILHLKNRYKAYLYLDEAHSIGAIGATGRGICEYYGCDPGHVDVLVGTFSKSFASVGGYIAGRKTMINHLRGHSHNSCYGSSMAAPVAQHVISIMHVLMGKDETEQGLLRVGRLKRNVSYFRGRLKGMGFIIGGDDDAPVIPLIVYNPVVLITFSRLLLANKVAIAIAGFPATAITLERIRICISAAHSKEMLDRALQYMDQIGDKLGAKLAGRSNLHESVEY